MDTEGKIYATSWTNAFLSGFAVALKTWSVWIMNVVPISTNNTLSAIYDRDLIGAFQEWCEPFSTYPRSYDLIHANNLFSHYKNREEDCLLKDIMLEMDRMLRPQGHTIMRDEDASVMTKIADLAPKFLWDTQLNTLENDEKKSEQVLFCRKKFWAIL